MTVEQFEAMQKRAGNRHEIYTIDPEQGYRILSRYNMRAEQWQALQSLEIIEQSEKEIQHCDPFTKGAGETAIVKAARLDFAEAMEAMGYGYRIRKRFTL